MSTHARERARERYGLQLTQADMTILQWRIQFGEHVVVLRDPDRPNSSRAIFGVRLGQEWAPVVYDRATKRIVTFLPPNRLAEWEGLLNQPERQTA